MTTRTIKTTREQGWDTFFLPTREDAEPFAAQQRVVTGREVETFEEEATCGGQSYTLFCVAVSPRSRSKPTSTTN